MLIDSATEAPHGETTGFLHDAFVYLDDEEFVRHSAPFLRDGVAAGEVVMALLPEPRIALLREVLGSSADQITFLDMTSAGLNPARLIPLLRNVLVQHAGRVVRGIGEPAYEGRSEAGFEEARLHEALLNVAFEHTGPFRLRCPYDAAVVSAALDPTENHPFVHESDGSSRRADPRTEVASMIFRTPLPAVPEDAERMEFGLAELTEVRHWVNARARKGGLSADRIDDLALALHEVCTNSIRFGGGRGELSLWIADDSLICEVADHGSIDDLLVGRVLPPVEGLGGRGVWLANQLCDLVQLRSGAGFTQVRLHTHLG